MKKAVIGAVLLAVGGIFLVLNLTSSARAQAYIPTRPQIRWEYRVADVREDGQEKDPAIRLQTQLNALGADGYELFDMSTLKGGHQVLVLKRSNYK